MKKHILLIDDDEDELNIFTEALKQVTIPCKCTWAKNGGHALKQLPYLTPDIILLDVNMPVMDGFTTLSGIRKLDNLAGVPVILYSTGMTPGQCARGMALGAAACIKKPETVAELSAAVEKLFAGGAGLQVQANVAG